MKKYHVTAHQRATRVVSVTVEASSPEEAEEIALKEQFWDSADGMSEWNEDPVEQDDLSFVEEMEGEDE